VQAGKSFLSMAGIEPANAAGDGSRMRHHQAAMDLHGFDLNLLVALDALLAEKRVTNAGRRVHLSQSAMRGVLARLRHALNDKLLVASRGGMTLTPLAESLVEPVRSIPSRFIAPSSSTCRSIPRRRGVSSPLPRRTTP
jgi:hypothetical protein